VPKFHLVLLIHAHQPVGNFDDVFERSYASSYLPFIEVLERHPAIRVGLHYSGPLLEWIERAHPEYFKRLASMVKSGQVEMVGGGFYEPVLIAIPPQDRLEQIARLADYIEKHFTARPRGAWLTERVWEPQIPSSLAPAGVEYTLLDDNHFLGAGFELAQLYGYYTAEDLGGIVKVLPGLKTLRYLIPFRDVGDTIEFLRKASSEHPGGFAAMGDDLEKFGVWPGTHDLCYRDGWLDNFFTALECCADWLEVATPAAAVASRAPLGRADLPTASYTEMMEWALPTPARRSFHGLVEEFALRPDALPFLRGGVWRNFFTKYSESNLMHKKMLHVSAKVKKLLHSQRREKEFGEKREEATDLLLRAQCNDAYWHGIFGGLYSPHLRTAVWRPLVRAEAIADRLEHRKRDYAGVATLDFDADGHDEIYFTSDKYAALFFPHDGGTIGALDCRRSGSTLINSLQRRPETYHTALKNPANGKANHVQSIHEQTRSKEEGLDRWLHYDRWRRHCFRLLVFDGDKTYQDCGSIQLCEDAALAGGRYVAKNISDRQLTLTSCESQTWLAEKTFTFHPTENGFTIDCDLLLQRNAPGSASVNVGLEVVLNFLAPAAQDRYFQVGDKRFPLRWGSSVSTQSVSVVDGWQQVDATIEAPGARDFWIAPIETVSESEEGFERIYQGSQVISVWPVELASGSAWKGRMVLRVDRLSGLP
jgi:4-alpha-glucanotransferase